MPTTLLLEAVALATTAGELEEKLRDAKMHSKFWKPTPLEIQSFGDPCNFGYTPLATDNVTTVPPLAETEVPAAVVLTDAQASRAYIDVKRGRVLKKDLESLTDCNETLMSTGPLAIKISGRTKTNMEADVVEEDWIEVLLRGNVKDPG